jgi:hypothetical protein
MQKRFEDLEILEGFEGFSKELSRIGRFSLEGFWF